MNGNHPHRPGMQARLAVVPALLATAAMLLAASCTERDPFYVGDDAPDGSFPGQEFTPSPNQDAAVEASTTLLCLATACPAPFATCTSGDEPAFKCGTDLAHDPMNCGTCGNECLVYAPIHLTSRCISGACELECYSDPLESEDRRNCNGVIDDGCESDILHDAKNCGACGKACAPGERCLGGTCGCPDGLVDCNGYCVDIDSDDHNCGACEIACEQPEDGCEISGAHFGCRGGTCGHLKCDEGMADCNHDLASQCDSNGCEAELERDLSNCGACGVSCTGDDVCINEGSGPECGVRCARFGKVLCPANGQCVGANDLLVDTANCGACGSACPLPGPHQVSVCSKGLCEYECAPGYADCNGTGDDGCETNIMADPASCGACGKRCDLAAGQPCIEGKCLVRPCGEGVETH